MHLTLVLTCSADLSSVCKSLRSVVDIVRALRVPLIIGDSDALVRYVNAVQSRRNSGLLHRLQDVRLQLRDNPDIAECELGVLKDHIAWLAAHINSTHLEVVGVPWHPFITETIATSLQSDRLTSLILHFPAPSCLYNLLHGCSSTLITLKLRYVEDDHLQPIQDESELRFPRLTDLSFNIYDSGKAVPPTIDTDSSILLFLFSKMISLRKLEITHYKADLAGRYIHGLTWPITEFHLHSPSSAHPFTPDIDNEYGSDFTARTPHLHTCILEDVNESVVPSLPRHVHKLVWHTRSTPHIWALGRWLESGAAGARLAEIDIGARNHWDESENINYGDIIRADDLAAFEGICAAHNVRVLYERSPMNPP